MSDGPVATDPAGGSAADRSLLPFTARQAHVGMRILLLAVLLAGAAVALLYENPRQSDLQTLLHDVREGRVDTVRLLFRADSQDEVRWSTGPLRWWTAPYEAGSDDPGPRVNLEAAVTREAERAGHTVRIESPTVQPLWANNLPIRPLMWLATAAWVITFLLMLGNDVARYATRWAWLWMFTVGAVGALLYLLLEPRPLWRTRGPEREPRSARRIRGLPGLLVAVVLGAVLGVFGPWLSGQLGERYFSGGDVIDPVLVRPTP